MQITVILFLVLYIRINMGLEHKFFHMMVRTFSILSYIPTFKE